VAVAAVSLSLVLNVITVALALGALIAAGVTIRDARQGQAGAESAHRETIEKQAALLGEIAATHQRVMHERVAASQRDQVMQRVIRLGTIGQLVADVAVVAGQEADAAGEFRHDKKGAALGSLASAVVPMLKRLEFELGIYEELGGEPQPKLYEWADGMQSALLPRGTIMDRAEKRLRDLGELVAREGEKLIELNRVEYSLFRESSQEPAA
jgi:hypothetical protein